jgi:aldehyde dehydrogenase (NAD+)
MEPRTKLLVGGSWMDGHGRFATINPATEEVIAEVEEAGPAEVDAAVRSAREAFESPAWREMDPHRRAVLLWRLADLVEGNLEEIAAVETRDNGKPLFESAKVDLPFVVANLRYYAGFADKICGEVIPVSGPFLNYTLREPVGVVGAIVPWNFPLNLASWKVAPALACGNTVVLKPAEETPLTALLLGELALEAGFPPGVLNVIPGRGPVTGQALVEHPDVDKIAFTGSTETGRRVMETAARTLKKLSLELGGKSPNVVFADADLEAAVRGVTTGIFYGKGEVCAAGSRLLVEASVQDAFLEALVERAAATTVGDPTHPKTRLGALVSKAQRERVLGYIEAGVAEGARLRTGGRPASVGGQGLLRRGHGVRRGGSGDADRPRGDLRPGPRGAPVRGRGRRDRDRQPHDLRARRGSVDPRRRPGAPVRARREGRDGLGEHLQPVRPRLAVRRLQELRVRPRPRPARPRRVHPDEERLGEHGLSRSRAPGDAPCPPEPSRPAHRTGPIRATR